MDLIDNEIRQWDAADVKEQFGDNLTLLPLNDNIKELQTILRDKWVRLRSRPYGFLDFHRLVDSKMP